VTHGVAIAVLAALPVGLFEPSPQCVSVWITSEMPGHRRCSSVSIGDILALQKNLCKAASSEAAIINVVLLDCLEGYLPPELSPSASVVQHVVRSRVRSGKAVRLIEGRSAQSKDDAVHDLLKAISNWHSSMTSTPR
jgi:hypothetical protein